MKLILALTSIFVLHTVSHAQLDRYLIFLKDKGTTTHSISNPSSYLSPRALDRRNRYQIPVDSLDIPVPSAYITQIQAIPNLSVLNVSKWLNAIAVHTSDPNALATISALPFVQQTTVIAERKRIGGVSKLFETETLPAAANRIQGVQADHFNYGTNSFNEIHLHNGEFLHNIGLRGQSMQIAMLDGGFFNYTTLDAFDSIITNNQVLSTWDFVNREASVVEDDSHGMMCLSTIAANIPGQFIGKAPKASFHLFKTEDVISEYPIEEFNWVCGAERADSTGADIISSSVGYNTFDDPQFNHTYNDMNGDLTISARGADLAAQKGLLVFNAVGNYGAGAWKYLVSPADGDSVVAVGAVNAAGVVWPSSSFGPGADGRIKPDLASIGFNALIQTTGNSVGTGNGTSFACPNMAGLGTCLWQGFPEFNNMRIARAMRESASKSATPDDRIGYGIPDMKSAFSSLLVEYVTSSVTVNSCNATLSWNTKDVSAMKFEIERKAPGETNYTKVGELNPAAGDILANHSYQFINTLANTATGTLSYRIRQILDTSAAGFTAVYIDTTSITLAAPCTPTATTDPDMGENNIVISPNPTAGRATLIIKTQDAIPRLVIRLYDMSGRLIDQWQRSKAAGEARFDLMIGKFTRGKYIVRIYNKQSLIATKSLLVL